MEWIMCDTVEQFTNLFDQHYSRGHNPVIRGRFLYVSGEIVAELVSQSNNPDGRPYKGKERRQSVTYRLQPSTIQKVKDIAQKKGCSQSDVIEGLVEEA